ncbi:MAG: Methylated-DNA--protein-cysteine methyltransferase [Candidatus Heimdallarchaeota archaeon AB_125]|nr:MAG: Methylated-DNA--protein-cysteine methyltransferase [Candidatus Heimdallarchaeota archaeon AB_125]
MMKIVVSKNEDKWAGILLNKEKLYYTHSSFENKKDAVSYLSKIAGEDVSVEEKEHPYIKALIGIDNGTDYDLPNIEFDFTGFTEKEAKVLQTLFEVPVGDTISYGELAKKAGFPGAAQFVGNVMMKNRFGPVIPCHRVILSNGKLGKFAGQANNPRKKQLLDQEKRTKGLDKFISSNIH